MFSNERLPFFFDSLHDRSRRRQALSAFLILTFSLSWGWTWLAPAPPAPGEMTHSLFFKTQSNILTFELLIGQRPLTHRVSGMIRLILTALVLFFTARSSGCCRKRHAWPLQDEPTFWMCVRFVSEIIKEKRLHSIFKMLDRGGITQCICEILWNASLDTWQRQCSAFRKKGQKRYERNFKMHFFFLNLHFPGGEQNLANFMSLIQQCADRHIDR